MGFSVTSKTATTENPIEREFRWYCEELQKHGFLKRFEREAETFIVLDSIDYQREKHYKTKPNTHERINLFRETTYTYDFRLIWTQKALNIFTEIITPGGSFVFGIPIFISHYITINGVEEIVSYVDVKPHHSAAQFGGGKMASYYTFPFIQKYLYLTKGLYINKIIPTHQGKHGRTTNLFATTFVPNRYLYTDKSGALRTIPYSKRSITSFVNQKEKIINDILKLKDNQSQQTKLL
jgi:hypothetical protein